MSGLVTGREIVQTARDENVPFMGASIAYYAIASIVPLLALLLAALSTFGGTVTLLELLRTVLSENGQVILTELLENTRGHGATGTLSLVLVVWSGSKVFAASPLPLPRCTARSRTYRCRPSLSVAQS